MAYKHNAYCILFKPRFTVVLLGVLSSSSAPNVLCMHLCGLKGRVRCLQTIREGFSQRAQNKVQRLQQIWTVLPSPPQIPVNLFLRFKVEQLQTISQQVWNVWKLLFSSVYTTTSAKAVAEVCSLIKRPRQRKSPSNTQMVIVFLSFAESCETLNLFNWGRGREGSHTVIPP